MIVEIKHTDNRSTFVKSEDIISIFSCDKNSQVSCAKMGECINYSHVTNADEIIEAFKKHENK